MRADLLVFVFPLWWGGLPAIVKGWFDRVCAYGIASADGTVRCLRGAARRRRGARRIFAHLAGAPHRSRR